MTHTVPPSHLVPEVSDRGLRYLPHIELLDGQVWRTYTSSAAEYAAVWTAIDNHDRSHGNASHLTVEQAWEYAEALEHAAKAGENVAVVAGVASSTVSAEIVRLIVDQLRWVVEHHHWGDMRPRTLTDLRLDELLDRIRRLGDPRLLTFERRAKLRGNRRDLIECVDELEAILRG